ncbi:hypothetical protein MPDQ_007888 [Monascus purpureus]|uniref:Uncharacterized protein n=1 Tax=Monascus purpureus TaxID=5098 RepID=A0A507R3Z4_MONPU|nr:hypothetical protein MPDQ_007888 [Monascus purpureus]
MSRRERTTKITKHKTDHDHDFDTPDTDKTSTPTHLIASRHSKTKTKNLLSSSFSSSLSKIQNRSLFSSASTTRFSKSTSFSSPSDQTTLTQIAFVTKPREPPSDDGGLDYIEGNEADKADNVRQGKDDAIIIDSDSENDSDADNTNTDCLPQARRVRTVRFSESRTIGDRANSRGNVIRNRNNAVEKNAEVRRSSLPAKSNKKTAKDKTLTQMKFVQPIVYIKSDGENDEEIRFDYIYDNPQRANGKKMHELTSDDKVEGDLSQDPASQQEPVGVKRRKLDDGPAQLPVGQQANVKGGGVIEGPSRNPVTPRKTHKFEIPSSQSPESPGMAVISSQFCRATQTPLKDPSPNTSKRCLPEGSPTSHLLGDASLNSDHPSSLGESTVSASSMIRKSPLPGGSGAAGNESRSRTGSFGRTIVYETDAESDDGDLETESLSVTDSKEAAGGEPKVSAEIIRDSLGDDSQTTEPPDISSNVDLEPILTDTEPPMSSNASICYRRQQLSTQFPEGPIPTLSTQKMAELFPQDSSPRVSKARDASRLRTSSLVKSWSVPGPPSQNQVPEPTQTQDNYLNKSTEIVPESSPVVRRDAHEPVVQVESSQPADRIHKQMDSNGDAGSEGILSRSQLLPSSVMESIPMPVFWMGSQDSVGEPYTLPDG